MGSNLDKRAKFDETLMDCVNTLRSDRDINKSINHLLQIISEFHNADRAYIFEFDQDMSSMNNTYEWCREGVEAEIGLLQDMDIHIIDRWLELFHEQGEVYINSRDGELSHDSEEYRILELQDITSLMVAPLYLEEELVGFIGVDNPCENEDTLLLLRSVASLVANDIQRRITAEERVIRAISSIYISMHVIDLPNDTQTEFKADSKIKKYVYKKDHAAVQMREVTCQTTGAEDVGKMSEFCELKTLNDRMSDVDHISHEFCGMNGVWCRANFIVVDRLGDGRIDHVIYAVEMIDEEKKRELEYQQALQQALENQNEIYGELIRMQSSGVIAVNADTKEVQIINYAAQQMLGFTAEEVENITYEQLRSRIIGSGGTQYDTYIDEVRRDGASVSEYAIRNPNGILYILSQTRLVKTADGSRIRLSSLMDITEKKQMEKKLLEQSNIDALTRIYNRGYGEHRIEKLLQGGVEGMFCLFDVDKFKSVNDTFGDAVGDIVLKAIARVLKDTFEENDIVLRLGGDEFAAFACGIHTTEHGRERIHRFFEELDKTKLPELNGRSISVSMGVVLCSQEEEKTFDNLYQKADAAMYVCKEHVGNYFKFYRDL